jgi:hypothetical protein
LQLQQPARLLIEVAERPHDHQTLGYAGGKHRVRQPFWSIIAGSGSGRDGSAPSDR